MADPIPRQNVRVSKVLGVTRAVNAKNAQKQAIISIQAIAKINNFLRSTRSAIAPAGSIKKKLGKNKAVCTRETRSGSLDIVAISQPAPTSCIQVPMFETILAIHIFLKIEILRGEVIDCAIEKKFSMKLNDSFFRFRCNLIHQ